MNLTPHTYVDITIDDYTEEECNKLCDAVELLSNWLNELDDIAMQYSNVGMNVKHEEVYDLLRETHDKLYDLILAIDVKKGEKA